MRLYTVTCDSIGKAIFFKAESENEARLKFASGMRSPEKYFGDPSFECSQVLSLDEFLKGLPEEFTINEDVSF